MEVVIGSVLAIVLALGGFAAFVISASKGAAKDQVVSVKALAETTQQQLLAHQEEDRGNYLDLKADLREIKEMIKNAKGPFQ